MIPARPHAPRPPKMSLGTHSRLLSALLLTAALGLGSACDRRIEPYEPSEQPRQPDLRRIFPAPEQEPDLRAEAPAPAASGGAAIRGRVELGGGLSAPAGGVLFVIARAKGAQAGPPLAVLRVPGATLPFDFEIGQADVMMPTASFAGEIALSARYDADGNVMSRDPGDLQGAVAGAVSPGATGVVVVLDSRL